jgi:predicted DNA-binding transcriptional regulator YafY
LYKGGYRGELTNRLLEIHLLLAERRRSQRELAEELGVSRRTIKRYLDALSKTYPIEESREGREVFYRFMDNHRYTPPALTPAELSVLVLAEEAIGEAGLTAIDSPFASQFDSLMSKVKSALPAALREKLDQLAAVFGSATSPAKDFRAHEKKIMRLVEAAIEHRRVRIRYQSLSSDSITERLFDPYVIYYDPDGATLKVIGYDHRRQNIIPFAIDHIRRLWLTGKTFERPVGFNLREFLAENCFNGIHGEPVTVRLRASGVTARIFAERRFHRTQRVVERKLSKAGKLEEITIEMRVAGGRGLLRFILSWGDGVEVLHPTELRQQVEEVYKKALIPYSARSNWRRGSKRSTAKRSRRKSIAC